MATRGRATAACGPATRRCSRRTSTSGRRRRPAGRAPSCPPRRSRSCRSTPTASSPRDPIKGTRPRGRDRAEDRALACELLASAKDRAENVMIVDVLRNDLGRVCEPGTVRVPRLCRLERTAAVQHLVSTVTGRLAAGPRRVRPARGERSRAARSPGAPKIRAMEILEGLEPVRRGPYTGALGWIGPDGAMQTSILIRTFVADGRRLTLHVGGGITWGSDPAAEWDETVAKARGPARRDRRRGGRVSDARTERTSGSMASSCRPTARTCRRSIAASSSATASSRRCARAAGARPSCAEHLARLHRSADGPRHRPARRRRRARRGRHRRAARRRRPRRPGRRCLDPHHGLARRLPVARRAPARRGSCRRRSSSRPGRSPRRRTPTWSAACTSSRPRSGATRRTRWPTLKTTSRADYVYARLEARRAGADDALFLTIDDHLSEATSAQHLPRPRGRRRRRARARDALARLRDPAGHDAVVAARLGRAGRPAAGRGRADAGRPRRRPTRRSCPRAWPGSCRSRVRRRADRRRPARGRGRGAPAPTARR